MDFTLLLPIGAGIVRNLSGWIPKALEDGTVEGYEWTQLLGTTVQVAVLGFAALCGLDQWGVDAASASGIALLVSYGLSELKKIGKAK